MASKRSIEGPAEPAPPSGSELAGLRFPDGEYTITAEANERLCRLVDAPQLPPGEAHPIFGNLAAHVGKGVTFAEFTGIVGAPIDAGFLFGSGSLEFWEPLRIDTRYLVRGGITTVAPHVGRKTGPFDVITTELELIDAATGGRVCRSREDYIVPRRSA